MRIFLLLIFILSLAVSSSLAQPEWDPQQRVDEFNRLVQELTEVSQARELLEASRVTAPDLERQERAYAEAISGLVKNHPGFFLLREGQLMARWFSMVPALEGRYQWMYKAFLGYHTAVAGSPDAIKLTIKKLGLEPYFRSRYLQAHGQALGAETELGFKHWLYETGRDWLVVQQDRVATGDRRNFESVLRPFLQNSQSKGVSEGAYKYLVASQPLEVRLEVLQFVYDTAPEIAKISFSHLFVQNISAWQWMSVNPDLFRDLTQRMGQNKMGAERFIQTYASEEFMNLRFNLSSVESSDPEIRRVFAETAELTVGQQLVLMSQPFRAQIFATMVLPQNQSWVLDLIDFAIENGYRDFKQIGQALSRSIAVEDPRWVRWMSQLGQEPLWQNIVNFVREGDLYQLTSTEAIEVHKRILQEAIRHVEMRGFYQPGEVDPLSTYLRIATRVPELRYGVVTPKMLIAFHESSPLVWRRFLTEVVVPTPSQSPLRYLVLEALSHQQITDVETLRILTRMFGVPIGFRKDLREARLSPAEGELRMMAWDQILRESAERGLPFRCSEIYAM